MKEEKKNFEKKVLKTIRLNKADSAILNKVLSDSGLTLQLFMESCVHAFLRGDPNVLKVIKDFKMIKEIPKEMLSEYVISNRERTVLLDEFEKKSKI